MSEQKEKKKIRWKGGRLAFAVCITLILVLLVVVGYLLFTRETKTEKEETSRNVVVNQDNVEEVLSQLETKERVPTGYYEAVMNTTWKFASGDVPSDNAYVKNAEANSNAVYFDIQRTDTGETIYESPVLPVGSHLEAITLDQILPAGNYDCTVIYHLLDEENHSVSTLKMALLIVIEE